jgi:hypothetical protein
MNAIFSMQIIYEAGSTCCQKKNEKPDQGSVSGISGNVTTGHKKNPRVCGFFIRGTFTQKK